MELAAASPVRTAAANFGRRIHSTLEGLKVLQLRSDTSLMHQAGAAMTAVYIRKSLTPDQSQVWLSHKAKTVITG